MAQDVLIAGALFPDVPSVQLPDSQQQWHSFFDVTDTTATASDVASGKLFHAADGSLVTGSASGGGGTWDWQGVNPTLVWSKSEEFALEDTLYASWSPSTTAKAIVASNAETPIALDLNSYEYVIDYRFLFQAAYTSGSVPKILPYRQVGSMFYSVFRQQSAVADMSSGTGSKAVYERLAAQSSIGVGYDSYGALAGINSSYGFYMNTNLACSFSDPSIATPSLTITRPALYARCNSTVFKTSNASMIDQSESMLHVKGRLWRVDRGLYVSKRLIDTDTFNNGV